MPDHTVGGAAARARFERSAIRCDEHGDEVAFDSRQGAEVDLARLAEGRALDARAAQPGAALGAAGGQKKNLDFLLRRKVVF